MVSGPSSAMAMSLPIIALLLRVRVSYQYALVSQDGNLFAYIDKDKRSMIPTGGEMTVSTWGLSYLVEPSHQQVEDDFGMYRNALHPEDVSSLFDDRSSVEASSQISQTPETNAHIVSIGRLVASADGVS